MDNGNMIFLRIKGTADLEEGWGWGEEEDSMEGHKMSLHMPRESIDVSPLMREQDPMDDYTGGEYEMNESRSPSNDVERNGRARSQAHGQAY